MIYTLYMHSSDLDVSKQWKRNEGNEVMKKSYSNSDKKTQITAPKGMLVPKCCGMSVS